MGRNRMWVEDMIARFEPGTFKEIDKVRLEDETRTDFVRAAVRREINVRMRRMEKEK